MCSSLGNRALLPWIHGHLKNKRGVVVFIGTSDALQGKATIPMACQLGEESRDLVGFPFGWNGIDVDRVFSDGTADSR